MSNIIRDLVYGTRLLRNNPGLALIIVLSIAIGVSANATVFSWIETIVLNPLPMVPQSDRLIAEATRTQSGEYITSSYADYKDLREQSRSFTGFTAFEEHPLGYEKDGRSQQIWAMLVTDNFFDVLDIKPQKGHFFAVSQHVETSGALPIAVISQHFWASYLNSDPSVIGKAIRLNNQSLTIIGVAPEGFKGTIMGLSFDVWVPLLLKNKLLGGDPDWITIRKWRSLHAIARLKPDVSFAEAQLDLSIIASRLSRLYPADNTGIGAASFPLAKAPYGAQQILSRLLNVLLLASFVVLLIVCANLTNLLLVRAVAREKEIGVRMALGASKARIFAQLTTEAFPLSILAAALSIVFTFRFADLLRFFVPASEIPVSVAARVDPKVLLFAVLLSLAAGLISGLLPALRSTGVGLSSTLADASRGSTTGRAKQQLRSALVVAEIALALVATTGAGLFIKNLRNIAQINPGFDADHVLLVGLPAASPGHTLADLIGFYRRVEERVRALPGVRSVSLAEHVPLGLQDGSWEQIDVDGYTPRVEENMNVYRNLIDDRYFDVMSIPLLDGRDFDARDDKNGQAVAIINQTFAKRFFGGGPAIGRRFHGWGRALVIVGVARDSKYSSPTEPARPYFYVPYRQFAGPETEVVLHVATLGAPTATLLALQREIAAMDGAAYVSYSMPLKEYIGAALFKHRMAAALISVLALAALVLAALGIYGVITQSVTQRTNELGVRVALGASASRIFRLVVAQSLRMAAMGLLIGIVATVGLARLLATLLDRVSPMDAFTLTSASLLLVAVSVAASGIPAYRAGRLDPVRALRAN